MSDPFVIDATVHAYNFAANNPTNDVAATFRPLHLGLLKLSGDDVLVDHDRFLHDWTIEELAHLLFAESDTSMATFHGVPWKGFFRDELVANEKGAQMQERWPNRIMFYAGINPALGRESVELAEYWVRERGARGIKVFPEDFQDVREYPGAPLDDRSLEPFLEKVQSLGVPLAVHKALPGFRGLTERYNVADVESAAQRFPDLQIEVVHSGMAFLEETRILLERYDNVWANLEVTSAYSIRAHRRFAEAIGTLADSGAVDRIVYASGACMIHPQWAIEALKSFQMPDDLVAGYGYLPLGKTEMENILGRNYARLHRLDVDACRTAIATDEFSISKGSGLKRKWSALDVDQLAVAR